MIDAHYVFVEKLFKAQFQHCPQESTATPGKS